MNRWIWRGNRNDGEGQRSEYVVPSESNSSFFYKSDAPHSIQRIALNYDGKRVAFGQYHYNPDAVFARYTLDGGTNNDMFGDASLSVDYALARSRMDLTKTYNNEDTPTAEDLLLNGRCNASFIKTRYQNNGNAGGTFPAEGQATTFAHEYIKSWWSFAPQQSICVVDHGPGQVSVWRNDEVSPTGAYEWDSDQHAVIKGYTEYDMFGSAISFGGERYPKLRIPSPARIAIGAPHYGSWDFEAYHRLSKYYSNWELDHESHTPRQSELSVWNGTHNFQVPNPKDLRNWDLGPGRAEVFQYNPDSKNWVPTGAGPIDGAFPGEEFGTSVSLSADGYTLAVGAPGQYTKRAPIRTSKHNNIKVRASGSAQYLYEHWPEEEQLSGSVRVYYCAPPASGPQVCAWTQIGGVIKAPGAALLNRHGQSVSLNGDGTWLSVGAPKDDTNATDAGMVSTYKLNNPGGNYDADGVPSCLAAASATPCEWVLHGAPLTGSAANQEIGSSVSTSESGHDVLVSGYQGDLAPNAPHTPLFGKYKVNNDTDPTAAAEN
ncbi:MAG: hypothetical protein ACKVIA_17110, partial [Rhodobacterales bacterium]